jgi:hypothetical protein
VSDANSDIGTTGRRTFLRRAGLAGLCGCGLATSGLAAPDGRREADERVAGSEQAATPEPLAKQWVAALLPALAAQGDRERARAAIRGCWRPHYDALGIQATLDKFRGNLDGFLRHLQAEWGWVVKYSPEQGVIQIDENKAACVCPVVPKQHDGDLGLLCACSEGFAEQMFSQVVGAPVRAVVVASVLRGDRTCQYRIEVPRATR